MSSLNQQLLRAQRKQQLQYEIQLQRAAISHNAKAFKQTRPLGALWTLAPSQVRPSKSSTSLISTLLLGLVTRRLGVAGKLLRLGATLYPIIKKKSKKSHFWS